MESSSAAAAANSPSSPELPVLAPPSPTPTPEPIFDALPVATPPPEPIFPAAAFYAPEPVAPAAATPSPDQSVVINVEAPEEAVDVVAPLMKVVVEKPPDKPPAPPAQTTRSVEGYRREPMRKRQHSMKQTIFRALAAMATLAAAIIMLFSEQEINQSGFKFTANYKFSPAFKFFVLGIGVACVYAFFSMTIAASCGANLALHFLDTLVMGLVIGVAAAATAVGYLGKKGNPAAYWAPVCGYADSFCNHATISIGCSYLGFVLLLLVCTLTSIARSSA